MKALLGVNLDPEAKTPGPEALLSLYCHASFLKRLLFAPTKVGANKGTPAIKLYHSTHSPKVKSLRR